MNVERDIVKILTIGIFGLVAIKLATQAGGVAQIVKAVGGVYTDTLGALSSAK